jgi:hypothetical protein
MIMDQARYFRELANRCYKLGRTCFDLDTTRQLNDIGDELLLGAGKLDGRDSVNSHLVPINAGNRSKRPN